MDTGSDSGSQPPSSPSTDSSLEPSRPSGGGTGYDLSQIIGTKDFDPYGYGPSSYRYDSSPHGYDLPSYTYDPSPSGYDPPQYPYLGGERLSYDYPSYDDRYGFNGVSRDNLPGSSDVAVAGIAPSTDENPETGLLLAQRSNGTLLASPQSGETAKPSDRPAKRSETTKPRHRPAKRSLQDRLDGLAKAMRASARLVEEISAELEAQAEAAKQLHDDAKRAEALAAIHKDGAEAIRHTLDAGFARSERHIRRDSALIAMGFFIAGSAVTLLVTLLVHPLY